MSEFRDVFISWTSADAELKREAVRIVKSIGYSVWESEYDCNGQFEQNCLDNVCRAKTLVVLFTGNSAHKEYVRKELDCMLALPDGVHRVVPVLVGMTVPELKEIFASDGEFISPDNIEKLFSVSMIETGALSECADKLAHDVTERCIDYANRHYRGSVYGGEERVYIPRRLCDMTLGGGDILTEEQFASEPHTAIVYAAGGCGKTQFTDRLTENIPERYLVFRLACTDLISESGARDVADAAFALFKSAIGDANYDRAHFDGLLDKKKHSGEVVLILDGLDELGKQDVIAGIKRNVDMFVRSSRAALIVTGRNEASLESFVGRSAKKYRLESFSEQDIRDYTYIIFGGAAGAEPFLIALDDVRTEIKSNPFLLLRLIDIYTRRPLKKGERSKLPGTVTSIMDELMDLIAGRGDFARMGGGRNRYSDREKVWIKSLPEILSVLAFRRSKADYELSGGGRSVTNAELIAELISEDNGGRLPTLADGETPYTVAYMLAEYAEQRAVLYKSDFAQKMFRDYFTAVELFRAHFKNGVLSDADAPKEYFSRYYGIDYWDSITELYISRASEKAGLEQTKKLFDIAVPCCGGRFDTLFSAAGLCEHADVLTEYTVRDLLSGTVDGSFAAYGPLFYYVPALGLYGAALTAANAIVGELCPRDKLVLVSLVRDVCYIPGGYKAAAEVIDAPLPDIAGAVGAMESGVRAALAAMFFGVSTAWLNEFVSSCRNAHTFPYYFDPYAVKTADTKGVHKCSPKNFYKDELGLYGMSAPSDEYVGLVTLPYDKETLERELSGKRGERVACLILTATAATAFAPLGIDVSGIQLLCLPHNIESIEPYSLLYYGNKSGVLRLCLPRGIKQLYADQGMRGARVPEAHGLCSLSLRDSSIEELIGCFRGNGIETVELPRSLKNIDQGAFMSCKNLRDVYIPDGVVQIGDGAFTGCIRLKNVRFPRSLRTIGFEAFMFSFDVEPASLELPEGLTYIGASAFAHCTQLKEIKLPESVEVININVFWYSGLTHVHLPDSLVCIGDRAFYKCEELEEIDIPDNVRAIGKLAFYGCKKLRRVHLPASLGYVASQAFDLCGSLTDINIPDGIETGWRAFPEPPSEKEKDKKSQLVYEDEVDQESGPLMPLDMIKGDNAKPVIEKLIVTANELPEFNSVALEEVYVCDGVTELKERAFENCVKLRTVRLPDSLTEIPERAFSLCGSLTEIRLPDSIEEIGRGAFRKCGALKSVILPKNLKSIGIGAFAHCRGLENIELPQGLSHIGNGAFYACEELREIELPRGLTEISLNTFVYCHALTSVRFPRGCFIIGDGAFYGCSALDNVQLPDALKKIGVRAFAYCKAITRLSLPNGLETIEDIAFRGCESLTEIELPPTLKAIAGGAFEGCVSLRDIVFPDKLEFIGKKAFLGCVSLNTVSLPAVIDELDISAFEGCAGLEKVEMPEGPRSVCAHAFKDCTGLKEVIFNKKLAFIHAAAFSGCRLRHVVICERFRGQIEEMFGCPENIEEIGGGMLDVTF